MPEKQENSPVILENAKGSSQGGADKANSNDRSSGSGPSVARGFRKNFRTILVRYGKMKFLGYFKHKVREFPSDVSHVIIKTDRGMELAEIVLNGFSWKKGTCTLTEEEIERYCKKTDSRYPLNRTGRVMRIATHQDISDQHHLDLGTKQEMAYCRELIGQSGLRMQLVDAEHLFGGERIVFYFMAEGRVDFRDLVKKLAQQYQTRIEMRQIGARDEARLIADYETCGRECCCRAFLRILQPVNMRMAKLQKATLDPTKISGRCGRLKCCLRYEDVVYKDLSRRLPRRNSWVRTENGLGQVLSSQVLTQLVMLRMEDQRIISLPVDEILELNCKVPDQDSGIRERRVSRTSQPRSNGNRNNENGKNVNVGASKRKDFAKGILEADDASKPETKPDGSGPGVGVVDKDGAENQDKLKGQEGGSPSKKKRRRRRPRRKRKDNDS